MPEMKIPSDKLCDKLDKNKRYTVLRGYVGEAGAKETTRLYLDWTMQDYVEVPTASISHHEKMELPTGGTATLLWIADGADVTLHRRMANGKTASTFATDLLAGDIARAELGAASRAALFSSVASVAGRDMGVTGAEPPCGYKTDYCTVTCAKECYASGRETALDPSPLIDAISRLAELTRLSRGR